MNNKIFTEENKEDFSFLKNELQEKLDELDDALRNATKTKPFFLESETSIEGIEESYRELKHQIDNLKKDMNNLNQNINSNIDEMNNELTNNSQNKQD